MDLQKEFKEWLVDYLPSEEDANGIAGILAIIAYRNAKKCFVLGVIVGMISICVLLKWLS